MPLAQAEDFAHLAGKTFAPDQQVKRMFICFFTAAALTGSECGVNPPAIREAVTGIFLWPAWGLYDSIKGDKFKHIDFSHG